MPWWILEVAVVLVLIAIAVWLGPFIKRFGRAYAADVFHDNPLTGKSYIVLTDIVYYLIFAAYILFMVRGWAASCSSSAHLLGDPHVHRLFDGLLERSPRSGLGHGLDDLALDEDLALAVAGGDAEVGLAGLAGAVDDAAHHGHAQRDRHALEPGGDLLGERVDVDLGPAARRARHDLELALRRLSDCRIWSRP
jgi:hypothetical protein